MNRLVLNGKKATQTRVFGWPVGSQIKTQHAFETYLAMPKDSAV